MFIKSLALDTNLPLFKKTTYFYKQFLKWFNLGHDNASLRCKRWSRGILSTKINKLRQISAFIKNKYMGLTALTFTALGDFN